MSTAAAPETICDEPGCDAPAIVDCYLSPPASTDEEPEHRYCAKHAWEDGFCYGCGLFWAGVESFDFSPSRLCENCCPSLEGNEDESPYDLDPIDDPMGAPA